MLDIASAGDKEPTGADGLLETDEPQARYVVMAAVLDRVPENGHAPNQRNGYHGVARRGTELTHNAILRVTSCDSVVKTFQGEHKWKDCCTTAAIGAQACCSTHLVWKGHVTA